ncbi:MAG: hypothetical protein R2911_37440 [Caldilineaceae bacterium]
MQVECRCVMAVAAVLLLIAMVKAGSGWAQDGALRDDAAVNALAARLVTGTPVALVVGEWMCRGTIRRRLGRCRRQGFRRWPLRRCRMGCCGSWQVTS